MKRWLMLCACILPTSCQRPNQQSLYERYNMGKFFSCDQVDINVIKWQQWTYPPISQAGWPVGNYLLLYLCIQNQTNEAQKVPWFTLIDGSAKRFDPVIQADYLEKRPRDASRLVAPNCIVPPRARIYRWTVFAVPTFDDIYTVVCIGSNKVIYVDIDVQPEQMSLTPECDADIFVPVDEGR